MRHATTADGTLTGVITGIFSGPQAFPTVSVPDVAAVGWQRVNGDWQKSPALVQAEQDHADDATDRETLKSALFAFQAGTATNAQVQRAIAWLLKRA